MGDNKILDARNTSGGDHENCSGTNSTSDTIIVASPLMSSKSQSQQQRKSLISMGHSQSQQKIQLDESSSNHCNNFQTILNQRNSTSYSKHVASDNASALYDNSNDLIIYDDNIYQLSQKNAENEDHDDDLLNLAIHKHKHSSNIYNPTTVGKKQPTKPKATTKSVLRNLNAFKSALHRLSSKLKKSSTNLDERSAAASKYLDSDVYSSCPKTHPLLHNLESSNLDSGFNSNCNHSNQQHQRFPPHQTTQNSSMTSSNKTMRKNYLYFNYNNNKMSYFNPPDHELTFNEPLANSELASDCDMLNTPKMMITSTPLISEAIGLSMNSSNNQQSPELLSSSSAKLKRLSGTEV